MKAAQYGVVRPGDVGRYLEYMMIYGQDFDSDSARAWASEILRRQGLRGKQRRTSSTIATSSSARSRTSVIPPRG